MEVVIKIEVKDNNVEQKSRVLRETSKRWFFKIIKLKIIMKPSEKKRIEKYKESKKITKNRI